MRIPSVFLSARVAILAGSFLLLPSALGAGFFTWKDTSGTVHFTDNYYAIPAAYRSSAQESGRGSDRGTGRLAEGTPQRVVIHFERQDNAIVVQGTLCWKLAVLFTLDTGASCTMITPDDARALGLNPGSRPPVKGYIADGSVVELERVVLPSLAVGGAEVHNLEVVIGGMRLLGMDFLREFHLTVDAGRGQLVLERNDGGREPETPSVTEEKSRTRSELEHLLEQIELAIKTRRSVIEQLEADVSDSEEKKAKVASLIEDARTSMRFESSDISADPDKKGRIEKYQEVLAGLNRHIEMRHHEMAIQQKQIDELEEKMEYYSSLIMKLR